MESCSMAGEAALGVVFRIAALRAVPREYQRSARPVSVPDYSVNFSEVRGLITTTSQTPAENR